MVLRTILVHADADERFMERLSLAAAVAREHEARLLVLYVQKPPASLGLYAEPMGAPSMELIQQEIDSERDRSAQLRQIGETRLRAEGANWEWRTVQGLVAEGLAAIGAATDMIVMGQPQDAAGAPVAQVALSAGRPVLCVPHTGAFTATGKRILVAWRSARESTRALHDALPLLARADHVVLFSAVDDVDGEASAADALRHLLDHQVKAELRQAPLGDLDAGTAILNAVSDSAADMLVMGAYGHSRLREMVFGGATRSVLRAMTVPTLISH